MNINYISDELRNLCGQPKLADRKLGQQSARKLQVRLQELFAAQTVTDLINGRPHPLRHDRAGEFALDLHKGDRKSTRLNSSHVKRSRMPSSA